MKNRIMMIGHVDHGKTALTRAMINSIKSENVIIATPEMEKELLEDNIILNDPHLNFREMDRLDHRTLLTMPKRLRNAQIVPVRTEPKVSRNAQCPCGSGKKNKRCCNQ